jgi:two-component system chemotaxis response regulator CheB
MPRRDIIVIGGSAGSFAPLKEILQGLPRELPASILIVVHTAEDSPGVLDQQFARWTPLPVTYPVNGDELGRGRIYVARADHHLTISDGKVCVLRGPRENRHRPAIDPLFRTAAREYGSGVIGVILSGQDDDGSAGLYAVKQRGGVAIVQDPREALAPEMPRRALEYAAPHYVLRTGDIAPNLIELVNAGQDEMVMPTNRNSNRTNRNSNRKKSKRTQRGNGSDIHADKNANLTTAYSDEGDGKPSVFACPECHGVLWELQEGKLVRFRCRVGHSFGVESLAKELSQASETALWAAMRALEEKAAMQRRIADGLGQNRTALRMRDQSAADETNARLIRDMIFQRDAALETDKAQPEEAA